MDFELERNMIQRVNVADCVRRSAALYGDRTAITDEVRRLSYSELHRGANQLARGLLELGVTKGDFVGIIVRNCPEFFELYFACARMGAVAMPMNPFLREHEYVQIAAETRPKLMVVFDEYLSTAENLARQAGSTIKAIVVMPKSGDGESGPPMTSLRRSWTSLYHPDTSDVEVIVGDRDPVQCIYTSGTTAAPKGVITSHLAAVLTALTVAHHTRIGSASTSLVSLPVHHVGGLSGTTIPNLAVGATVVLHDGWDRDKVAATLQNHRVTSTILTAPMWMELLVLNADRRFDWSTLQTCMCAIATLPPEHADQLRQLCPGADVLLCSGQTEATSFQECQTVEEQFTKPTAWGSPTLMTDVAIMDDSGTLLRPHEVGEIVYRSPQAMTEYFAHEELTETTFAHGWLHSGDLGYVDDEHTVFFVDRKKDMIKTGGENVASVEVSLVVLGCPGVADCAVVGLPHPRWTEAITAFVLRAPGSLITEADLLDHCRRELAPFKVPKRIVFTDQLPRTASGKVQKVALREQHATLYT